MPRYPGEPTNALDLVRSASFAPAVMEVLKNPVAPLFFPLNSIPWDRLKVADGDIPYAKLTVADGDIPATAIDTIPRATARRSTNQTINNNTITAISFDTEVADTDTMFAATDTKITCVTGGLYLCNAQTSWSLAATATTRMVTAIRMTPISGSGAVTIADDERTSSTTEGIQQNISRVIPMVAGDYIELVVFQTNAAAGTRTVAATSPYSPLLSATRLGKAA
jgi:hypothetical protein